MLRIQETLYRGGGYCEHLVELRIFYDFLLSMSTVTAMAPGQESKAQELAAEMAAGVVRPPGHLLVHKHFPSRGNCSSD